jgi:5-methylcytosine-specific restriction endonuclease McrA
MIDASLKRCEQCAASYDTERHKLYDKHRRDKKSAAFYNSTPWKVLSADIKVRDHQMCKLCLSNRRIKPVDVVHHIKELRDYPRLALVKSNLISLCAGCHRRVHAEYDKGKLERNNMEVVLRDLLNKKFSKEV